MKRRQILHLSIGVAIGIPGCQRSKDSPSSTTKKYNAVMDIFSEVTKVPDGWQLKVKAVNQHPRLASLHNVVIVGYASDGTKVCEAHVGDLLPAGDTQRTVETTCSAFPAIITATARESPCENAVIPVVYWVGTDAQKTTTLAADEIVWKTVNRKCGEEIPPQRVLDKFDTSTTESEH